jgi:hypothetical protein
VLLALWSHIVLETHDCAWAHIATLYSRRDAITTPSRREKGDSMEGIAVGFVFLIYGIIASILACGSTLLIGALMLLVSRWWPPLGRVLSWPAIIVTFIGSLILIFRAIVSCSLVLCLL